MSEYKIQNLHEVLSGYIKSNQVISDKKITNLTAPGENFGSIMLKMDITLKDEKNGTEEELHTVAKMIPAHELIRELFNVQVTFKNEIAMYNIIAPLLRSFQRENGINEVIDCFAECYGARINLGEKNSTVDENGVLILENLIVKGYQVADRHAGFDLETTKLILKDLAAFHGIPLALKLKKPQVFDKKIRPYLAQFNTPFQPHEKQVHSAFVEILQESNKCLPWISKVKEIFDNTKEKQKMPTQEPFATVTHGDIWVNNTMIKFQNGLPVSNKLVDFQVCDYKSPASDVFFFLFTSVQLSALQDNFDDLIEFYHKHFISHLEKLKCDIAPFGLAKFLEEMKATTSIDLYHTLMMLFFVVYGKKGGSSKDFDPEAPFDSEKMKANIHPLAREKAWYVVHTCGTKGWLQ